MKPACPDSECFSQNAGPNPRFQVRKKGYYYRRSDGQHVRRYQCTKCSRNFSSAALAPTYRQKKRHLNRWVLKHLCSGVSQRRTARLLGVNPKTVVRKFRFLADQARLKNLEYLKSIAPQSLTEVQWDDLETSEHTKCKPISVALAVDPYSRKVLGFRASRMPAKGTLSELSRRKYGPRKDERPKGWNQLLSELTPIVHPEAEWLTDQNPHYPQYLKRHFPRARHKTTPGGRGCIAGQGELRKKGHDPMFALNHTCAMLRADMNRLFRRTWCTTKTLEGLVQHLELYTWFRNQHLTPELEAGAG